MNRQSLYYPEDKEGITFIEDEKLPSLPLPKLEDTLQRYYESLKPFGTAVELENSRRIIKEFQNGIGRRLHSVVEKKASTEKNWVEKWWEDYAYHSLRFPLHPYTVMAMALPFKIVGIPETEEYALKAQARCIYHTLEFWDLLHREKMHPSTSPDGSVKYSMNLLKRFLCTSRLPGDPMDKTESHFKTRSEGGCPTHGILMAKGRIFKFECVNEDGSVISPQQLLCILQNIRATVDCGGLGSCVPVLTNDDRAAWAKNRTQLQELSGHNRDTLKLVESSIIMAYMDEHIPNNYSDNSLYAISGDFHSKWCDRSSILAFYRNGNVSCIGEHSAYDGTISVSYAFFILLSLLEASEPDWNDLPKSVPLPIELEFDLNDTLKTEIQRVMRDCDSRRNDVIVVYDMFDSFGKNFLKENKLHPDAFVQVVLQLAYYKMHEEWVATYETALMRQYYNGRTETLRSCTSQVVDFIKMACNPNAKKKDILHALRKAIDEHNKLMSEARKGNGVDRHLFGLWCAATEQNLDIPELYSDPLYSKSGGGGNFILSTSTLGYTAVTGFVAPMVMDGYGFFYSMTSETLYLSASAYRASMTTSAHKFLGIFYKTLEEIKAIIDDVNSKL